jgi:hypothetical protein
MSSTKNPSRDPVQIFCTNFPAHRDLVRNPGNYLREITWPKIQNDDTELRVSRYTLEVLDIVTSGQAKDEGLTNLIHAVLELYGPSPVKMICNISKITSALIESKLYSAEHKDLEKEVIESVSNWRDKAVEACKLQYPELAGFHGHADYIMLNGYVRWAPTVWIKDYMLSAKDNA